MPRQQHPLIRLEDTRTHKIDLQLVKLIRGAVTVIGFVGVVDPAAGVGEEAGEGGVCGQDGQA